MTDIVREHNLLTGYRFTIVEFALVGLGLSGLVAWYLATGRFVEAVAWFGIVGNAGTMLVLAVDALRHGAMDLGPLPLRRRSFRDAVATSHPRLGRRTAVLVVALCVPYLVPVAVLAEQARMRMP